MFAQVVIQEVEHSIGQFRKQGPEMFDEMNMVLLISMKDIDDNVFKHFTKTENQVKYNPIMFHVKKIHEKYKCIHGRLTFYKCRCKWTDVARLINNKPKEETDNEYLSV